MAATAFPIFGTGALWKVASGSGTPSDPFVPAINVSAGAGQLQTPWLGNINGAGFTLSNAIWVQPFVTPKITAAGPLTVGSDNPIDTTGGGFSVTYPNPSTWANEFIILRDVGGGTDVTANNLTITHYTATLLGGLAADYVCNLRWFDLTLYSDGVNVSIFGSGQTAHPVVNISALFSANIYTLLGTEAGQILDCATNTNSTIKIDTDAHVNFPLGSDSIVVFNSGTGIITLVATTPGTTTLNSNVGGVYGVQTTRIGNSSWASNQGVAVSLKKRAANLWNVFGPCY